MKKEVTIQNLVEMVKGVGNWETCILRSEFKLTTDSDREMSVYLKHENGFAEIYSSEVRVTIWTASHKGLYDMFSTESGHNVNVKDCASGARVQAFSRNRTPRLREGVRNDHSQLSTLVMVLSGYEIEIHFPKDAKIFMEKC